MKKPEELNDLLSELRSEIERPSASYEAGARVVVYVGRGAIHISAADAVFLLHSEETVERLYDALGAPDDCGIELHSFEVDDDVKSALDTRFSTVDEL